jgi:Ser/Thr protein kinase RdoA (MazF antagonist)
VSQAEQAPASAPGPRNFQAEADAALAALTEGLEADQASLALAVLLGRAAARLHTLARTEASGRKGTPSWPTWAGLQNAARTLVLNSSTCRDLAARLAGRRD